MLVGWPLPKAANAADKEDRGHVLVVAGSRQMPGAAMLSVTAALRAGAGKVTLITAESAAMGLAIAIPEARVIGFQETAAGGLLATDPPVLDKALDQADVILVGPGLLDAAATCDLVQTILRSTRYVPCVLDALAMDVLKHFPAEPEPVFDRPIVMTPHAGEMAHLTDRNKDTVLEQPRHSAVNLSRHTGAVIVLKGAETLIAAPDGRAWRHLADIPGLAVSGSGDVLAGLIAALVARGAQAEQAAVWAVALHAAAGKKLTQLKGPLGYLPRELMDEIPALMARSSTAANIL